MKNETMETFSSTEIERQRLKRETLAETLVATFNKEHEDNPVSYDGQHIIVQNADRNITTHFTVMNPYPDGRKLKEHIAEALTKTIDNAQ